MAPSPGNPLGLVVNAAIGIQDGRIVRVGKRTDKAVTKGAKDTGKQAKRAARGVKKVYSRKARQEANGEKAKKDSIKASTNP